MKAFILILPFLIWINTAFKTQHYENDTTTASDELCFLFQMTRHGARSPYENISSPRILSNSTEWKDGFGALTAIGERQHYLLAAKHKKKYKDYLSKKFNPNELYIISTDVNRTIMSAYSEINSWFPLESVEVMSNKQRQAAVPPFEISDPYNHIRILKDTPTYYGFQPIPIHVGQGIDQMLRAMDEPVCPSVVAYEERAKSTDIFKEINEKYKDNIIKDIKENWGVEGDLDFVSIKPYTDYYYATYFNRTEHDPKFDLDISKLDELLADQFYFSTFYYDEMVRIASSKFLNFLNATLSDKIYSMNSNQSDYDYIRQKKFLYFSAHDSTVAAVMSGIQEKQRLQPFYAIPILIELWKKAGTEGTNLSDFYIRWIYNGNYTNVNNECDKDYKCDFQKFTTFLKSREVEGDWDYQCQNANLWSAESGKWYIVAGVSAGVLFLGVVGYFIIKRMFLTPKQD